jgi:hypothetical protein
MVSNFWNLGIFLLFGGLPNRQDSSGLGFSIEFDADIFIVLDELAELILQLSHFVLGFVFAIDASIAIMVILIMHFAVLDNVLLDRISHIGGFE